jgi:hypothetical protein
MNGENSNQEKLEELIQKNLEMTEDIYKMTKSIKSFINFQKVMSVIYFLIIVLPLIAGFIFLPPLLKNIIDQYNGALGDGGSSSLSDGLLKAGNPSDIRNISPEIQRMLGQ